MVMWWWPNRHPDHYIIIIIIIMSSIMMPVDIKPTPCPVPLEIREYPLMGPEGIEMMIKNGRIKCPGMSNNVDGH